MNKKESTCYNSEFNQYHIPEALWLIQLISVITLQNVYRNTTFRMFKFARNLSFILLEYKL